MAKINGSDLLVYANGTLIAYQKSCTVSWEQELPDATAKDSGGWEEHLNGTRRCTCNFDGLFSSTGLSAAGLITYITGRTSCVLLIDGTGYPIVGEARPKNLSVNATMEESGSISGSFVFDGPAWMLSGDYVNLMTDPDAGGTDYDTMTVSGIKISSAVNDAGTAYVESNTASITTGDVCKVFFYCAGIFGNSPTVALYGTGNRSNVVTMVTGLNVMTLTADATSTLTLRITNSDASSWSTTNIYWFKV